MSGFPFPFKIHEKKKTKLTFEELYHTYAKPLYGVAFAILHNREDAEDAVSTAFCTIFANIEKYEQKTCQEMKPLCVMICRNAAIDIYRKNMVRSGHVQLCEAEESLDRLSDVEESFFEKQDYKRLLNALQLLPDAYRDAMYLYYVEDCTTEEITKLLQISEAAFRKRIERGKKHLRKLLEESEQDG